MAYYSGEDLAYLFVEGVDVKASNAELAVEQSAVVVHKHVRGQAYPSAFVTGHVDGTLTYDGWFDTDTQPYLDRTDTDQAICVLHEGNTAGNHFIGVQATHIGGFAFGIPQEDIDTYRPDLVVDGMVDFGTIVAAYAARTTDSNTDAADVSIAATASSGGRAYLQIGAITLDGATGVTCTLRHSADGVTWADHANGAFTIAAAVGAEVLDITASVNKYLSLAWAWTGGGGSQAFTAMLGFAAN